MVERARERLGGAPNAIVAVEDGQSLTFADKSFDAVLCSLGLMFFPDPARGLSEFHRVLRPGGRAAGERFIRVLKGSRTKASELAMPRKRISAWKWWLTYWLP